MKGIKNLGTQGNGRKPNSKGIKWKPKRNEDGRPEAGPPSTQPQQNMITRSRMSEHVPTGVLKALPAGLKMIKTTICDGVYT
jgi:hypothetical protein